MIIGFTGTREAITDAQRNALTHWLTQNPAEAFHHGDCLGADAEAHRIVRETNHQTVIHVHPCKIASMRANCDGDVMKTPMDPLARNRMIVRACDVLLAAICDNKDETETWTAMKFAKHEGKRVVLFMPSGEVRDGADDPPVAPKEVDKQQCAHLIDDKNGVRRCKKGAVAGGFCKQHAKSQGEDGTK